MLYLGIAPLCINLGRRSERVSVSRASGITFAQFGTRFLRPLADVVLADQGKRPGDVF